MIHVTSSKISHANATQVFDSTSIDYNAHFALLLSWRDFLLITAVVSLVIIIFIILAIVQIVTIVQKILDSKDRMT